MSLYKGYLNVVVTIRVMFESLQRLFKCCSAYRSYACNFCNGYLNVVVTIRVRFEFLQRLFKCCSAYMSYAWNFAKVFKCYCHCLNYERIFPKVI